MFLWSKHPIPTRISSSSPTLNIKKWFVLKFHHLSLRKNTRTYFPLNPGWFMTGSLLLAFLKNPKKNWVGWKSPKKKQTTRVFSLKGIYPTNTHHIRCIWGWLLRVPSQGYHHFPYVSRFHQLHEKELWVLIEELGETCDPIEGAFHITSYATPGMCSKFLLSASPPGEVGGESWFPTQIWNYAKNI